MSPLTYYQSYAVFTVQVEMRLFCAICDYRNYLIGDGDVENAYEQYPTPDEPTYVRIDDQYADWYFYKYKVHIDRSMVLTVLHALQGHLESGALWAKHSIATHTDELGLKSLKHAPFIWVVSLDGHEVLICK